MENVARRGGLGARSSPASAGPTPVRSSESDFSLCHSEIKTRVCLKFREFVKKNSNNVTYFTVILWDFIRIRSINTPTLTHS